MEKVLASAVINLVVGLKNKGRKVVKVSELDGIFALANSCFVNYAKPVKMLAVDIHKEVLDIGECDYHNFVDGFVLGTLWLFAGIRLIGFNSLQNVDISELRKIGNFEFILSKVNDGEKSFWFVSYVGVDNKWHVYVPLNGNAVSYVDSNCYVVKEEVNEGDLMEDIKENLL